MPLFPRVRKHPVVRITPHSLAWLEQSRSSPLSQHQSRTECLGVGKSIPKPADGGPVVPKLISSLLLDVSNGECHVSSDGASGVCLSCSAIARNLPGNFNLLCFLHNLCIKWTLCLEIVVVILFWLVLDTLGVSPGTHTYTDMVCITWANTLSNFHVQQHHPLHTLIFGRVQSVAIYVLLLALLTAFYCSLGICLELFHVCPNEKLGISKLLVWQFRMWKVHCLFCPGNIRPWSGTTVMSFLAVFCVDEKFPSSGHGLSPPTGTPRYLLQNTQFTNY